MFGRDPDDPAARPSAVAAPAANRRGGSILIIDFHRDGNSAAYRTDGWRGQEQSYVWSLGASSFMRLPPPAEATPLVLDIDVSIARLAGTLSASVLRVFVNGAAVGSACLQGRTRLRCAVPASLIRANEPIELRFDHPCFVRIDFLQDSRDNRPLGLCFYGVSLYPPWLAATARPTDALPQDAVLLVAPPSVVAVPTSKAEPVVYRFGNDSPGRTCLRNGWRFDADGGARAGDRYATLELPAPARAEPLIARFDICPMFIRSVLQRQRVNILLSGAMIGQFRTGTETAVSVALPPELIQPGKPLRFTLALPDGMPMHTFGASQPRHFLSILLDAVTIMSVPPAHRAAALLRDDDVAAPEPVARSERFLDETIDALAAAVKAGTGTELAEILRHFESLGDNCSFGLAQGKGGGDVMGLLRFANTPLTKLMNALDDEFRALTDKSQIVMRWVPSAPGEFVLYVQRYGIRWHTNVCDEQADQAALFAQQAMRLSYLRRKFYEGLAAGRKIMTISRAEPRKHPIPMPYAAELDYWEEKPEPLRFAEILPLFLKLNQYGRNTLLYLTRCERGRRPGTVELLAPGIMRGYVDDFVISNDPSIVDHATWMRIAVNAWLLEQGPNAAFRQRTE
jgi:hypothetical protein